MPRNNVVEADTRRLRTLIRQAGPSARQAVRNVAFAVERLAKQKAPVDTGALRASIYTVMDGEDNTVPMVPSDEARRVWVPAPRDMFVAHVGPSVDYGLYVELGTRYMAAQPYLLPALREAERIVPGEFRVVAEVD